MPPLPTDFIFPEACKPICEKLLTLPTGDVVKISELNMNKVTAIRRVVGVLVKDD